MPIGMRSKRPRTAALASHSRGYHASGVAILRPSASVTTSSSAVKATETGLISPTSISKVLMLAGPDVNMRRLAALVRIEERAPSAARSALALSHKLIPPIPLRVEQCGEIAVIDPRCRHCCNRGFGAVGDAEAGVLDHAEIVGAVADHQRIEIVEIEGFAQLDQRCEFCRAAQDRFSDLAGQFAVCHQQLVGAVLLKADHGCDRIGE